MTPAKRAATKTAEAPAEILEPEQPQPAEPRVQLDDVLTVDQAVSWVTANIKAIAKERKAAEEMGGFKFRGIEDALNALHPLLPAVGLNIYPRTVEYRLEVVGKRRLVTLDVEFDLVGPDGSVRTVGPFVGEGGDGFDKAAGKSHSNAYKMMAFQVFSIPVTDASVDSEAYNPNQDDPPTLDELWQRCTPREIQQAETLQERLEGYPSEWADRVIGRMRERARVDVGENVRDFPPGWLNQFSKIMDKADEAMAKAEAQPVEGDA